MIELKGKYVSDSILADAKEKSNALRNKGIIPCIALVRVGEDSSDVAYEKSIIKIMDKTNIDVKQIILNKDISKEDFKKEIIALNEDERVNGILVFRPLPKQLDEKEIRRYISPKKDIDCFSEINMGRIFLSDEEVFYPCTPMGVMKIIEYYDIDLEGKNVVIVGRSLVVGKPLSMMLMDKNATVTICHSRTKDLPSVCKKADIVIAAIGRGKMIDSSYIKKGSVVIDVGINFIDGKMVGDVDYDDVKELCSMITPVPGGVGIVTTSCLAYNLLKMM